jgi:hypothetical protein
MRVKAIRMTRRATVLLTGLIAALAMAAPAGATYIDDLPVPPHPSNPGCPPQKCDFGKHPNPWDDFEAPVNP